ncbi:uncharacterized protein LOC101899131 isoform X1 [Musca domestica]|uniref:Uncharacterized protein LOC101899131 isoform X1 n=1 Tax=Musca domestica TaxID=7370 RepID=T1PGB5_MUSDO|nr:uncharacterized protein LOC101899131 isoform X1 [Musca domestica]
MAGALKYVFVAVAIFCYMQQAEMARLPRNTGAEPALPANIFEAFTKPEFWNSLSKNISDAFTEENLKKYGIRPVTLEDVKEGFAKVQENVQTGFAELQKNVNNLLEQNQPAAAADAKPKKQRTK